MGIRKRGGGCFEGDCGWGCVPIVALLGDEDDLGRLAWLASAWVEALGVARVAAAVCVEDEGNNKAVKTKHLSEDKNQDHTNKQPWLLSCATNTRVTDNANGKASGKASAKVDETTEERVAVCATHAV